MSSVNTSADLSTYLSHTSILAQAAGALCAPYEAIRQFQMFDLSAPTDQPSASLEEMIALKERVKVMKMEPV